MVVFWEVVAGAVPTGEVRLSFLSSFGKQKGGGKIKSLWTSHCSSKAY